MLVNVIGACNIDITALAGGPVRMHDSNPAAVRYTHGGVGRNIAHNCALLGLCPASCPLWEAVPRGRRS